MSYAAVLYLSRKIIDAHKKMTWLERELVNDGTQDFFQALIKIAMHRAYIAGLCQAMTGAIDSAVSQMSRPSAWHAEKINFLIKKMSDGKKEAQ